VDEEEVAELTGKLENMGFTTTDVTAVMRVTGGHGGSGGRDSTDAALDWLCLNVPEARGLHSTPFHLNRSTFRGHLRLIVQGSAERKYYLLLGVGSVTQTA
jgi:hypothetical protein